jgi:hypothetical protein
MAKKLLKGDVYRDTLNLSATELEMLHDQYYSCWTERWTDCLYTAFYYLFCCLGCDHRCDSFGHRCIPKLGFWENFHIRGTDRLAWMSIHKNHAAEPDARFF